MIKRIEQIVEYLGISIRAFEQTIGASNGLIRKAISNNTDIQSKWLSCIVDNYPQINSEWLLTGRGDMLKDSVAPVLKDEQTTTTVAIKSSDEKGIPLIPLEAVAGVMSDNNMQILKHECEYYNVPLFKNADFLMQVTGDSMQPKYYSGDIVACRKVFIGTFFQWNRVYVIDTNQGVVIKRVKQGADPESIRLVSENRDYDPFDVPLKDIYSLALVVGVVRAE